MRSALLFTIVLLPSVVSADDTCGDLVSVEVVRGESPACLPRCAADLDCRPDDGIFCDPDWHACAIPNTTVLVPRACPGTPSGDRDRSWSDSTPIAQGGSPSAIAMPDGSLYAVFAAGGSVRLAHIGATESPRVLAPSGEGPSLARNDTFYAAWITGGRVQIATSRDGAAWSDASFADAPGDCDDGGCTNARIAAGATAAYVSYVPRGGGLRVRSSSDRGETWSRAVTVLDAALGSLAVGADGRVHAIGLSGNALGVYGSAERTVQYAVSLDRGATWSRPAILSGRDEKLPFVPPALAIDTARHEIYAAYVRGSRTQIWDLALASLDERGRPTPRWRRTYITDPCARETLPALALDPKTGTAHLAWYDERGGGRFAHATCTARSCTARGSIGDRAFSLSYGAHSPGAAALALDAKRNLHALWSEPADGVLHATVQLEK